MKANSRLASDLVGKRTDGVKRSATDIMFILVRILIVADIIVTFVPSLNPARISGMINRNLSLFTCGVSYSSIVRGMGRAMTKGWISEAGMKFLFASCAFSIAAMILYAFCGCVSLGNGRFKKIGAASAAVGAVLRLVSLGGVIVSYNMIRETPKPEKVAPVLPVTIWMFIGVSVLIMAVSVCIFFALPKLSSFKEYSMEPKYRLFLMLLPILVLTFLFSYLPLLGWRYAFFDYKAGEVLSADKFVGFKWFTQLFRNSATKKDIFRVIKNTLAMSGLGIATSWVAMVFAIFLSEIKNSRFKRFVQTFTTIPNFISWVLVYAIAMAIFSTDGFVNTFLTSIGDPVSTNYLMDSSHMWLKMLAWGLWKSLGWNAIIYIAAISGIDQQLYEAATVDGAGRFQKMWYVTVPALIPTYMVLLLMSIANILTNGMDQYLVFSNPVNKNYIEVLDLYVYNLGIGNGIIPLSTVIGMVKSVISVILLFTANGISKAVRGESIV